MRTFACVYKTGGDYEAEHVYLLKRMVEKYLPSTERFVCLTDSTALKGVDTIPLKLGLRGKYSMMEVFFVTGTVLVTGLDTIFMSNMDRAYDILEKSEPLDFWLIKAFNAANVFANGMMGWNSDWSRLITAYDRKAALKYKLEQTYTIEKLKKENANIRVWNDEFKIESYKKMTKLHGIGPPEFDIDLLLFHGFPRPFDVTSPWVQDLYRCVEK